MKITVDRASVCMGDDMFSHERTYELPGNADCQDLLKTLRADSFFASVSGNNVVWVLTAGDSYVFAYYTKTERYVQYLPEKSLAEICAMGKPKFSYYTSPSAWKRAMERLFGGGGHWREEIKYCESLEDNHET